MSLKRTQLPYTLPILLNLFMSDHTNKIDGLEKSIRQVEQNLQKSERKMDQFIEKTDQFIEKTDQLIKKNEEKMDMIISQLKEINKNSHASNQRLWSLQNELKNPRNASFNTQNKTKELYTVSIENWDRRFQASQEELKKINDKYEQKFEKTNAHISAMLEENKKNLQAIRDSQKSNKKLQQKQQKPKFSNLTLIKNYVGKSFTSLSNSASSLFSSWTQCLGLLNKPKEKLQMVQEQVGELISPSQELHTEPTTSFIGLPSTNKKRQH